MMLHVTGRGGTHQLIRPRCFFFSSFLPSHPSSPPPFFVVRSIRQMIFCSMLIPSLRFVSRGKKISFSVCVCVCLFLLSRSVRRPQCMAAHKSLPDQFSNSAHGPKCLLWELGVHRERGRDCKSFHGGKRHFLLLSLPLSSSACSSSSSSSSL